MPSAKTPMWAYLIIFQVPSINITWSLVWNVDLFTFNMKDWYLFRHATFVFDTFVHCSRLFHNNSQFRVKLIFPPFVGDDSRLSKVTEFAPCTRSIFYRLNEIDKWTFRYYNYTCRRKYEKTRVQLFSWDTSLLKGTSV